MAHNQCIRLEAQGDRINATLGANLSNNLESSRRYAHKLLELCAAVKSFLMVKGAIKSLHSKLGNFSSRVEMPDLGRLHACTSNKVFVTNWTDMMRYFALMSE